VVEFVQASDCPAKVAAALSMAQRDDVDTVVLAACWYCYLHHDPRQPGESGRYITKNGQRYSLDSAPGSLLAIQEFVAYVAGLAQRKTVYVILSQPVGDKMNPRSQLVGSRFGMMSVEQSGGISASELKLELGTAMDLLKTAVKDAGAVPLDPTGDLCSNGFCPVASPEGVPIYVDGVHVRASFVRRHATFLDVVLKGK